MKTVLINNKITKACLEILCFVHCRLESCCTELHKDKIWCTICKALGNCYFTNKSQNNIFILFLCISHSCCSWFISLLRTVRQFLYFPLLYILFLKLLKKSLASINNNKHLLSLNYVLGTLLVTRLRTESHSKANLPS